MPITAELNRAAWNLRKQVAKKRQCPVMEVSWALSLCKARELKNRQLVAYAVARAFMKISTVRNTGHDLSVRRLGKFIFNKKQFTMHVLLEFLWWVKHRTASEYLFERLVLAGSDQETFVLFFRGIEERYGTRYDEPACATPTNLRTWVTGRCSNG